MSQQNSKHVVDECKKENESKDDNLQESESNEDEAMDNESKDDNNLQPMDTESGEDAEDIAVS